MTLARTAVIVQSSYIPWKGTFDLINLADELILFDDAQYTRRDWRNRNIIKTPLGPQWLTIPVQVKGRYFQKICDVKVSDPGWGKKHWSSIVQNYARARYFRDYREVFEPLYLAGNEQYLSQINHRFIVEICRILGINTRISWSRDYPVSEGKTQRLIALCKAVGATNYLSGPTARAYMDEPLFDVAGVRLSYMDYSGYPEYDQLHGAFEHAVTILDLIFNEGRSAPRYMKSFVTG